MSLYNITDRGVSYYRTIVREKKRKWTTLWLLTNHWHKYATLHVNTNTALPISISYFFHSIIQIGKEQFLSGKLIVSKYAEESITIDARRFGHKGLCQLLTKAFVAETTCINCYWFCYVFAHHQFPDIDNVAMIFYNIIHWTVSGLK